MSLCAFVLYNIQISYRCVIRSVEVMITNFVNFAFNFDGSENYPMLINIEERICRRQIKWYNTYGNTVYGH